MPIQFLKRCAVFVISMFFLLGIDQQAGAIELPRPGYDNSFIFSIGYNLPMAAPAETEYIKHQFGGGLYAPLTFSSFLGVDMDWRNDPDSASSSIQSFKNTLDKLVASAKVHDVGIHIILTYGLSRNSVFYTDAKNEDIRNAQWYNDNNMASRVQLEKGSARQEGTGPFSPQFLLTHHAGDGSADPSSTWGMNQYVYTTFSRYARKLRRHLEAKVRAAADYTKQVSDANPGIIIIISAPGEAEMNATRINQTPALQHYFCDYSPFAVLEFRDWIRHTGMYGPGGAYDGQGYGSGGPRYQGASGLANFNSDFGTAFTTWNLEYYHWSLSDPVDPDYTDGSNPDGKAIPFSGFTFDGMMPTSGPGYTAGGFDPPRVMETAGASDFYDLWHRFRELMVYHYVKDMTRLFRESGFPKDRYFSHQIPADYLWGTRPGDPRIPYLNPRYYASASPLWTADVYSDMGIGVTMYDINFGSHYDRTTLHALPAISALSDNWGVMEYNPEITTTNNPGDINTVNTIYTAMKQVYEQGAHIANLYRWEGPVSYGFKGNNREYAAKKFFDAIKDNARQPVSTMLTPPIVKGFTAGTSNQTVTLGWSRKIWSDLGHQWSDWGDFKQFVIYRGINSGFHANSTSEIGRTTDMTYQDSGYPDSGTIYYKIAAVNNNGQKGPLAAAMVTVSGNGGKPELTLSRNSLNFGAAAVSGTQVMTPVQEIAVDNTGSGTMSWNASVTAGGDWLQCSPASGVNSGILAVSVSSLGKPTGTYDGVITVNTGSPAGGPKTINVTLRVYSSSQDAAPFGTFATPLHNSTVRSSIPVTGWAVDDIGVESVKIYRQSGAKLVYIGDATFVEGARPDVEAAYASYPNNYKAGWGYMMLTNFLPNQGNGVYVLHAVATDAGGHKVTLGTKTITGDNANAIEPFGAIDTPTQGGAANGGNFINWGWVLTPQPDVITGSSSISVYVDGIFAGHPVYGNYREDISGMFKSCANSDGAVGYFYLDTTQYKNGLHTIEWRATDSGGDSGGIGSRFFSIRNIGGSSRTQQDRISASAWVNRMDSLPTDPVTPLGIVKGYKKGGRQEIRVQNHNSGGVINTRELQRLEFNLENAVAGYLMVGNRPGALPAGSTFDPGSGRFCWSPGPGHYGKYRLMFITDGGNNEFRKRMVTINILPR